MNETEKLIKKIKGIGKGKVKFVFLFGSVAEGKNTKFSDIDFAIYYDGSKKERFDFRLMLLNSLSEKYDIQIFQDLPLHVKANVLKGKLVYSTDEKFVYEVAYDTLKRLGDFKKYTDDYIKRRKEIWGINFLFFVIFLWF